DSARINGRETIASCQRCDFCTMEVREGIRHHDQSAIRLASLSGNHGFEFGPIANRGCDRLYCEGHSGSEGHLAVEAFVCSDNGEDLGVVVEDHEASPASGSAIACAHPFHFHDTSTQRNAVASR